MSPQVEKEIMEFWRLILGINMLYKLEEKMAPGETGELFSELTGEKDKKIGREHLANEPCGYLRGEDSCPECDARREDLEKAKVAAEFIQSLPIKDLPESFTTVSHPEGPFKFIGGETVSDPGDNWSRETSGGPSGAICICGAWVPYGQTHQCNYDTPVVINVATDGYACIFCNKWVNSGDMHTCLFTSNENALILEKLNEIEKILKKIARWISKPEWKEGSAEDFLNDIMGKEEEDGV
jgi:hypothetical protein